MVLSIGEGEDSRVFRTTDGGATWSETFRNAEPAAFYNCLDFYPDGRHGLAVSDPVDGKFRIIATDDGGASWEVLPSDGMPDSTGEFNFSASGDCLTIAGRTAWFGSGGSQARVFRSTDHGLSWTATDSTLRAGEAAGVFGLAFRAPHHGVAVGGDFDPAATDPDGSAYSRNGRSWRAGGDLAHLGEDVAWASKKLLVVTGESGPEAGSSWSRDGGRTWEQFSDDRVPHPRLHVRRCLLGGRGWRPGRHPLDTRPMSDRGRVAHLVVGAVASFAVLFQLVLVIGGGAVLDETDPPTLVESLARFFLYFTIQSNILVAVTGWQLARDPRRDGPGWRVVRTAGRGRDHHHRHRALPAAAPAAPPRGRRLAGRQAAAHGGAAARGRRLGGVRAAATDRTA